MPESIHFQQRRLLCMISKVVPVLTLGKVGRGCGLGCKKSALSLAPDNLSREEQNEASKVASSAQTTNHHLRLLVDQVELFHRLQTDNSLMYENMIQAA